MKNSTKFIICCLIVLCFVISIISCVQFKHVIDSDTYEESVDTIAKQEDVDISSFDILKETVVKGCILVETGVDVSSNTYKTVEGGYVFYIDVVDKEDWIDADVFEQLTPSSKINFLKDTLRIASLVEEATDIDIDNMLLIFKDKINSDPALLAVLLELK